MKTLFKTLSFFAIVAMAASCKPTIDAEIGAPGSNLDGINAEWKMVAAQIVDNRSLNGDSISIMSYYKSADTAPEITFNSATFEYSVVDNGKRNFFSTNGTWAFDDEEYPTLITLTTAEGQEIVLNLTRTIRPQDTRLMVNYERNCDTEAYATYYFEYERK